MRDTVNDETTSTYSRYVLLNVLYGRNGLSQLSRVDDDESLYNLFTLDCLLITLESLCKSGLGNDFE